MDLVQYFMKFLVLPCLLPSVVSSPKAFNNVRSVEIPGVKTIIKKTPILHIYIIPNTSRKLKNLRRKKDILH